MFEPGTVVDDRWEIVGPLDTGSMSVVYRGRDRADGHPVAVKVMKPEFSRDPVLVQRCIREARVVQGIVHPHVVRVEGAGMAADGRPFIVMELLEGETLELRIARGRIALPLVAEVVSQVADAVDAAHAAGIVHRDLKPDNCFLLDSPGGAVRVKILDFGFAKLSDRLANPDGFRTESNALLGTPLYMSPEQVRASRDVDHRSDLWSLGIMAYELLVGAAPFDARPLPDLLLEILSRPIPPPSARAPGLPPALDSWVVRALDRTPERRFQSGRELADAFAAALRGVTTPTEPPPPPPAIAPVVRPTLRPRSLPRWVALAITVAAALATLVAVLLGSRRAHGAATEPPGALACPPARAVIAPHEPCASSSSERVM